MNKTKLVNEHNNVFDFIRSSTKGILDSIETDFKHFFPEEKYKNPSKPTWFFSEHFGFFHNENFQEKEIMESYQRKICRFYAHCNSKRKVIFIRTCVIPDYISELKDLVLIQKALHKKFPNLRFIILFLIPDQECSAYYKHINNELFVFTLNDKPHMDIYSDKHYQPIFDFVLEHNLFEQIPEPNSSIHLMPVSTRSCLVENNKIPAVPSFQNYVEYDDLKPNPVQQIDEFDFH